MKQTTISVLVLSAAAILPTILHAQTLESNLNNLQNILTGVQKDMTKDCEKLINIASAIGGFGALFYIGYRVWKHIANAEPIDFFPLFRPFVLALLISIFPDVLAVMEGVLSPITAVTDEIYKNSNAHVKVLLERNDKAVIEGTDNVPMAVPGYDNPDLQKYDTPEITKPEDSVTSGSGWNFGLNMITNAVTVFVKMLISKILELMYFAASLCISAMRTFHLVILSILGPLVFAFAIYDGLQHTLAIWIGRYINIYLWLPIANLFGSMINRIQINLLQIDYTQQASTGATVFTQTDLAYMVFLVIAIFGYFSIPSIANFVVHASGDSALMRKVTGAANAGVSALTSGATSSLMGGAIPPGGGGGSMPSDGPGPDVFSSPMADAKNSEPYQIDSYQRKQLKG